MTKKYSLLVAVGFLLFSCQNTNQEEVQTNNVRKENQIISEIPNESVNFDFTEFQIGKGNLGNIKIGMTISEAQKQFHGLTKKVGQATDFGYGGGSPAYLYYLKNDLLFALIPTLNTDSTLLIIAANKNFKTAKGLYPTASVAELLEKYPQLLVEEDLMNGWEYFSDTVNNWNFVFKTNEKTQIGEYPEMEVPSKPKRVTTKADWITIR